MLIMEGTGEGIGREATERNCCKKASNTLMVGMAMAAAMSGTTANHRSWGEQRRVGGQPRMSGALPDKKATRKRKQAQQRKNRKK